MTAAPRRVELRIRRLELDSSEAGGVSRAALCAAVEAELSLLLGPAPAAPATPTPADSDVTVLARRIARAVHRELRVGEGAS
ncbi:hypothetical protein [Streptomyces sp. NPDC050263]|uniref:hypothetical protein n=1 Tax=Streptomyces sp. NPDC050263 TaxID=3155037 RepID=UPI003441E8B5